MHFPVHKFQSHSRNEMCFFLNSIFPYPTFLRLNFIPMQRKNMLIDPHFLKAAGERYGDFVVTKFLRISELNCILRELLHLPSGAQVMHIANDDPENLFSLSFKTYPSSSNGVAHILEHTVLCGSRKFPVKDPFFSMSRRSLNTFMNAMTGSDFTCYPAASQNEKDFYNLMDVYIDAVFHPELKRMSFLQEGHRFEFADPKDPKTPLEIKGIVFNEMKGNLASADTRLWHALMEQLIPDLTYAHNSGGDPRVIPDLTYAELIAFHETYYHPSRCLFFFYGDLPLKNHLDFIAEKALMNVPHFPPIPPLKKQQRFHAPVHKEIRYPVSENDELSNRTIVTFGYLTAPLLEQEEVLALNVLDSVLMETDASLLKSALLQSGLCIHADAYMDVEMSEVPYAIVCKGCDPQNLSKLEETLKTALADIIKKGIPASMIDAAIHQLEFSRLEIIGDHAPFGLTLFMRSALAKQHGSDPENSLMVHSLFEGLLSKVKDPGYLTGLIKKHLLDNPHCVRLVMHPDPALSSEEIEQEKQRLKEIQSSLTETEVAEILKQTQELAVYQKQTEYQSLECLPKVSLDDVTLLVRDFPLKHYRHGNFDIYHHDCFTNHILYADLVFDLPMVSDEDLPYVHLLTSLLPEIGSAGRSYTQNLDYMQAHTGGIAASCALHMQTSDPKMGKPSLNLRGKALRRKMGKLFTLMRDTLERPRLDEKKRIEELVKQLRDSQLNRLNRQAMRYAIQLSISGFSSASHVSEAWYGLSYFKTIEGLCKDLSKNVPRLIDKLLSLKEELFTFHNPQLILSCPKEMLHELQKEEFFGLGEIKPSGSFTPWKVNYPPRSVVSQARVIPSQVAFTSEAFKTIGYLHAHAPALTVAAALFDNKILHRKIREQGGAYGCGATYSSSLGHFNFHSFRDPHIKLTLDTFKHAIEEISAGGFTDQDLEEAKLGIIQQFDVPISPGSRALTAYAWLRDGKTKGMRQQFRDRLLSLTHQDLKHAVETELLPKKEEGVVVSFAGKELLEKENGVLAVENQKLPIFPI
jgi:Zn-dependent M16 (insulinase) family peptidase